MPTVRVLARIENPEGAFPELDWINSTARITRIGADRGTSVAIIIHRHILESAGEPGTYAGVQAMHSSRASASAPWMRSGATFDDARSSS